MDAPLDAFGLQIRPLDESTWPDFARLAERHDGVWGGCWCMSFHSEGCGGGKTAAQNREEKRRRVCEGRAHAALVYNGEACVGWCQFGSPEELPRIKNRRVYQEGLEILPDWRITCFFVDKSQRKRGVAQEALKGALREIARLGGGAVESYPEDLGGKKTADGFIHNGTIAMFERAGFRRARQIGKNRWVVRKVVGAELDSASRECE